MNSLSMFHIPKTETRVGHTCTINGKNKKNPSFERRIQIDLKLSSTKEHIMIPATSGIGRYDVHNFVTFKLVKKKKQQQQLQESRDTQVVT